MPQFQGSLGEKFSQLAGILGDLFEMMPLQLDFAAQAQRFVVLRIGGDHVVYNLATRGPDS